jgi:hypothetical protein
MRHRTPRWLAGAVLALVSGCSQPFSGAAVNIPAAPIGSVLVYENLGSTISESARASFRNGLVDALRACRLTVIVHDIDPLSLDSGGDDTSIARSLVTRTKSDALLVIAPASSLDATYNNATTYQLRLIDTRSGRLVWQGQGLVRSGLDFSSPGSTVGANLVQTIATSRTLTTCPS